MSGERAEAKFVGKGGAKEGAGATTVKSSTRLVTVSVPPSLLDLPLAPPSDFYIRCGDFGPSRLEPSPWTDVSLNPPLPSRLTFVLA